MRKLIVAGVFVLALGIVTASWAHGRHSEKVLTFKTNVGVVPPYTGSPANAVLTRGIQGPEPPGRSTRPGARCAATAISTSRSRGSSS